MKELVGIRFLNCRGHGKHRLHFGELEQFQDAWAHPGGNQPDAFTLTSNIMPHDHAQTGGIHVGHIGQVED